MGWVFGLFVNHDGNSANIHAINAGNALSANRAERCINIVPVDLFKTAIRKKTAKPQASTATPIGGQAWVGLLVADGLLGYNVTLQVIQEMWGWHVGFLKFTRVPSRACSSRLYLFQRAYYSGMFLGYMVTCDVGGKQTM